MSRKKRTLWTPKKAQKFLDLLRAGNTVSHAAMLAGVARTTVYEHRVRHAGFAVSWKEAEAEGVERLEQEAIRRAVHGVQRPVFHRGRRVGLVREYSDTLLIFLLKGRKPETYRERLTTESKVHVEPVKVEVDQPVDDPDRIAAITGILASIGVLTLNGDALGSGSDLEASEAAEPSVIPHGGSPDR